ncbi:MAG: pantetheine-phosphate adenylyltransferase [Candidatus Cloacimonadales bacterium]
MKTAIYPGTFDPITNGHIDILQKASKLFDRVILAVAEVTGKQTMFSLAERTEICQEACAGLPQVEVKSFSGLSVDFALSEKADAMIRGLRAVSDFEYELSLALMNKKLEDKIETVFFVPANQYLYLSSTMIRQIVSLRGNVEDLIPECVEKAIKIKIGEK